MVGNPYLRTYFSFKLRFVGIKKKKEKRKTNNTGVRENIGWANTAQQLFVPQRFFYFENLVVLKGGGG